MQNFFRLAGSIQSAGAFFAPMKDAALSMVDARGRRRRRGCPAHG
jgi:hypothetical protein